MPNIEQMGRRLADMQECPTCEGVGRLVDISGPEPQRIPCRTCGGHGRIDAGVWPYQTFPKNTAASRPLASLCEGQKT